MRSAIFGDTLPTAASPPTRTGYAKNRGTREMGQVSRSYAKNYSRLSCMLADATDNFEATKFIKTYS